MGNSKYSLGMLLRLITLGSVITTLSCAASSTRLFAHTVFPPIGNPDVGWEDPAGAPQLTTFNSATGILTMAGPIVSFAPGIDPLGNDPFPPVLVGGSVTINALLVPGSVAVGGGQIHADFVSAAGITGVPDYTITDSLGGGALTGNLGTLAMNGYIGSPVGIGGAIFTPTGGYLLDDFGGVQGGMVALYLNVAPSWNAGSYAANWSSDSKGDIGPVPEPATIALLGTGLLGMLGYSRRRFWKRG